MTSAWIYTSPLASLPMTSPRDGRYFEAVQKWAQIAQSANNTAYTSSWAGEENPNGSRKNIEAYLEQAKGDVEDSADVLKSIIEMLDLPPAPKYKPARG